MKRLPVILAASLFFAAAPPDLFRFSRPIAAPPGWARLALPDDVLDACRTGLPDLRVRRGEEEVPWALEERIGATKLRMPLKNVERSHGRETTALLDRGTHPPAANAVTLEIDGEDFLKPLTVESSDDGFSWKTFASGSVFATARARSTTLRFPRNDRRWWRFRFDDRNGDPLAPRAATVQPETSDSGEVREIPLALPSGPAAENPVLTLPAANLGIFALRIESSAPAYSRRVRVLERVLFREELVRRVVGEGVISRTAAAGSGNDLVPIGGSSARAFELEVERMDGPALPISRAVALTRPRAILFSAPAGVALRLLYGSPLAEAPRYDLERALGLSRPSSPAAASLGPPDATGAPRTATGATPAPGPPRGATLDPAGWKFRESLDLPGSGSVAYLDLTPPASSAGGSPRIIDDSNRQVPYLFERAAHRERHPVETRVVTRDTKTVVELLGMLDPESIDAVEISAQAPAYFSREAVVVQTEPGDAGSRILGSSRWEKAEEDPASTVSVPIARPSGAGIRIEIENGDNAPVTLGPTRVWTSVPRIDFLFSPGDRLTLLSGNPDAPAPRYDLELIASRLLSSPALPARVRVPLRRETPRPAAGSPRYLWVAIVVAAALVLVVLARTLRPSR